MKMKMIILWITLCGSFLTGRTQYSAGTERYYNADEEESFSIVQVEWFQYKKWYAEVRYNYEASNSFSLNVGRSYERKGTFSYYLCPLAAVVWGRLHGGSIGLNADFSYKKLACHIQDQFTFSIADRSENFVYSWSELGYQAFQKIETGILLQQLNPLSPRRNLKKGCYVKIEFRNWTLPLYVFDLASNNRSLVLGVNFEMEIKKQAANTQH